jgi:hypothetical protein
MPRFWSNQRPSVLVMMPRDVPAQPKASTAFARVKLPGLAHLTDGDASCRHRKGAAIRQWRGPNA